MKKLLILGSFEDEQTAVYMLQSAQPIFEDVAGVDIRRISKDFEPGKAQEIIIKEMLVGI